MSAEEAEARGIDGKGRKEGISIDAAQLTVMLILKDAFHFRSCPHNVCFLAVFSVVRDTVLL